MRKTRFTAAVLLALAAISACNDAPTIVAPEVPSLNGGGTLGPGGRADTTTVVTAAENTGGTLGPGGKAAEGPGGTIGAGGE